jgi:predicted ABC-class ATPase
MTINKVVALLILSSSLAPALAIADTVIKSDPPPPKNETELTEFLAKYYPMFRLEHDQAVKKALAGAVGQKYFWGNFLVSGEVGANEKKGDCVVLHEHYPGKVKDAGWNFQACVQADGIHLSDIK